MAGGVQRVCKESAAYCGRTLTRGYGKCSKSCRISRNSGRPVAGRLILPSLLTLERRTFHRTFQKTQGSGRRVWPRRPLPTILARPLKVVELAPHASCVRFAETATSRCGSLGGLFVVGDDVLLCPGRSQQVGQGTAGRKCVYPGVPATVYPPRQRPGKCPVTNRSRRNRPGGPDPKHREVMASVAAQELQC